MTIQCIEWNQVNDAVRGLPWSSPGKLNSQGSLALRRGGSMERLVRFRGEPSELPSWRYLGFPGHCSGKPQALWPEPG